MARIVDFFKLSMDRWNMFKIRENGFLTIDSLEKILLIMV